MKAAFQGKRGAFSEIMANKFYNDAICLPCKTFKDVFDKVNNDAAEAGVIPIENTLTGRISESTDLLITYDLKICREGMLPIIHCLIANQKTLIGDLERVYVHPEALYQCKKFLRKLNCELISWYDGAGAASIVKNKNKAGLIASEKVADIYQLKVLKKGVQDSKTDITRFVLISKQNTVSTGSDKTSLIFSLKHRSGKLYHALKSFADESINLTRLESMPSKNMPWEYQFLVDFEGHIDDQKVELVLQELKKHSTSMKILGSYPCDKAFCRKINRDEEI